MGGRRARPVSSPEAVRLRRPARAQLKIENGENRRSLHENGIKFHKTARFSLFLIRLCNLEL
jgi:hypothetical protein